MSRNPLDSWRSVFRRKRRRKRRSHEVSQQSFNDFAERALLLHGRLAAQSLPVGQRIGNLSEVEFRVFSQWGEDGIIEWLVRHVDVPNHRFVEFGVESFVEANCRFLMMNRNWRGFVLDGSASNIDALRAQPMFWKFDLTAKPAFVTAENIDALVAEAGFDGPLGLLSIDVDGNDYWIWRAMESVQPAIVVCEFNPIFGDTHAVSVPYDPKFSRFDFHPSGLYFGASIAAIRQIAEEKGYTFVGTNSNGINAFFVRTELCGPVLALLEQTKSFPSRHRDSRDEAGRLSFTGGAARFDLIRTMPVVDVTSGATIRLDDIHDPYSDEWKQAMA